jgi:two-component system, OmpR family, alkaline phosphatase synthesis response regulator PhoP
MSATTPQEPTGAARQRCHILVADDEPHIGRIIQLKLERAPYDVSLVSDGRAAMERLAGDERIDLVLLDIMMPYLSGLDVLEQMRRLPHRSSTPVIVLTAKGQDADRERALELGAVAFLTKPFSPNKLLVRINEILG